MPRQTSRTITMLLCDGCDKETASCSNCLSCNKVFCFDCAFYTADRVEENIRQGRTDNHDIHCVKYEHAVHFSGSYDGLYCLECDSKLTVSGTDKLHNMYRQIKALRLEEKTFYDGFKVRYEAVEKALKHEFDIVEKKARVTVEDDGSVKAY